MSIRLIAVDMDGTFLDDQETYNHERFIAQYQQMKTQDIRFVVASGNQYYQSIPFSPGIADEIAFVTENSGWVMSEGKDVFNGELSKDAFATVVEHLLTRPEVETIAYGKNSAYALKKYDDTMETVTEMYCRCLEYVGNSDSLEDIFFGSGLNLPNELILQVQKILHEAVGDIMISVHIGDDSIDLITPDIRKANDLRQLQELWGIDDSEVVVFGDGGSDIETLCQAGFNSAIEDAGNAVVVTARYRAGSNNREGVLDMIDKVLKHEVPFDR